MHAKDKLARARTRLLLRSAFFGTLVVTTPTVITRQVKTAATDMRRIAYNPDFLDGLTVEEIIGLIAHEVLHIALMHGFRRQHRDPKVWNYACDYAINQMLFDQKFQLPKGGLLDPEYRGMSAEQIYDLLVKDNPPRPKPKPQSGGDGTTGEDATGEGSDPSDADGGKSRGEPSFPAPAAGDSLVPGWGADLCEPTFDSPEAERAARDEVKSRIVQAVAAGRMAGNMPADMLRALDDLIHPPVPWQDVLRPYMQALVSDDESWARRNRRFSGVYLPARSSPAIGCIVVIGDTSGSITNDDLKRIGGSVVDIAEDVRPQVIHMLWADTHVAGRQVFDRGDVIQLDPKGGGGTDMRVPLAEAETYDPAAVILITDGWTPWPAVEPPFPLITVCTTSAHVPVGEVVRI